jgi:hypothetical protein
MRFFIPLRSIQNDKEEATKCTVIIPLRSIQNDKEGATKSAVISNEPIGDVRDLSGDAMCCNGRQ